MWIGFINTYKRGEALTLPVKRFTAMISDDLDKRVRDYVDKEYLMSHGRLSLFATKAFSEYLDRHKAE